mgnify:CR=1 FL=1
MAVRTGQKLKSHRHHQAAGDAVDGFCCRVYGSRYYFFCSMYANGINGTVWSAFFAMVIAMVPVGCFINAGSSIFIVQCMLNGLTVSCRHYILFGISALAPAVVLAVFILRAMFLPKKSAPAAARSQRKGKQFQRLSGRHGGCTSAALKLRS